MAKTNSKNTGGRPTHFTKQQVSNVIDEMLAQGHPIERIDGKQVRALLLAKYDVTPGIREESVGKAVKSILAERDETERRTLLKALPVTVEPAVDDVLVRVRKDLMLLIARENATCMTAADKECEVLRADKFNANWRITELETRAEEQARELAALVTERDDLVAELAKARQDAREAQAELERLGSEASYFDRFIARLRNPEVSGDLRAAVVEIVAASATVPRAT